MERAMRPAIKKTVAGTCCIGFIRGEVFRQLFSIKKSIEDVIHSILNIMKHTLKVHFHAAVEYVDPPDNIWQPDWHRLIVGPGGHVSSIPVPHGHDRSTGLSMRALGAAKQDIRQ